LTEYRQPIEMRSSARTGIAPGRSIPPPWLETPRLALREFVASDLEALVRMEADPLVARYVGNGKPTPRDGVVAMLGRMRRYPRLYTDLGVWHASRVDTGAFVGWFALKYAGKSADVEVGYRLRRDAWGHGYATEGAIELVRYGFDTVGVDRIIGVTHPDNVASQRVLMKAGLEDSGWGRYYDERLRLFAAMRKSWKPNR
jgi:RimJ/RimL family protein N-acetyltransferase